MATEPVSIAASADVLAVFRIMRRALGRAATQTFARSGVGPKQVLALRELRDMGSVTQVELARATVTDPAAMMRVIDSLERRGWVERSSAEDDRRCKRVSLTPEGRRSLREVDADYERLRSVVNGALSTAERKQFCALAAKVAVVLEAAAVTSLARDGS